MRTDPRYYRHKDGKAQKHGLNAEQKVAHLLKSFYHVSAKRAKYKEPYDLLIAGRWKCEVKSAQPRKKRNTLTWFFNIHRHGKLKEACDFYILRFEEVPGVCKALHGLMEAPIKRMTLSFSLRSLLESGAPMFAKFKEFCRSQSRRSGVASHE